MTHTHVSGQKLMHASPPCLSLFPQVIASKTEAKAAIVAMCSEFNIAHDNPVMIMDQETSKRFLVGKPEDQYNFFMKATGMIDEYEALSEVKRKKVDLNNSIKDAKAGQEGLQKRLDEAKHQFEKVKGLKQLSEKIATLDHAKLWSEVEKVEGELGKHREARDAAESKVNKMIDVYARMEAKLEAERAKEDDQRQVLQDAEEKKAANRDKIAAATEELENALEPLGKASQEVKLVKTTVEKARMMLNTKRMVQKNLRDEIAKRKAAAEKAVSKSVRLQETEAERDGAEQEYAEAEAREQAAAAAKEEAVKAQALARGLHERELSELDRMTRQLSTLQSANQKDLDDPFYLYKQVNHYIPKSAVRIAGIIAANKGKFSIPPLGPVATLLRVRDPSWSKAIEAATFPLHHFVCTSKKDADTLEGLVKQADPSLKLSYVVRSDSATFPRQGSPPAGFPTLLDRVDIESPHPAVYNLLMDSSKYDRIALLNAKGDEFKVQPWTSLTKDGNKIAFHGSGTTDTWLRMDIPGPYLRGPKTADKAAQIAELNKDIAEQRKIVQDASLKLKAAEGDASTAGKQYDIERRALEERRRRLHAAKRAFEDALKLPEDREDDEEVEDQARLDEAESDVATATENLAKAEARLAEAASRVPPLQQAADDASAALLRLTKDPEVERAIALAVKAVEEAVSARKKAEEIIAKASEQKTVFLDQFNKAEAEVKGREIKLAEVYKAAHAATGLTEQYAAYKGKSVKELTIIQETFREQLITESKKYGGSEAGEEVYFKAERAYKQATQDLLEAKERLASQEANALEVSRQYELSRKQFFMNKENYIDKVSRMFELRALAKGHLGKLVFDSDTNVHDKGRLKVYIIPDAVARRMTGMNPVTQGQEVGSLSGGEKSFNSLILLSAIARVAEPAFRIIDEFDVFQDEATRKLSMKYLLEDATSKDGYEAPQFILLTPHDISSGVEDADALRKSGMFKVLKMAAPRGALGAGAGAQQA